MGFKMYSLYCIVFIKTKREKKLISSELKFVKKIVNKSMKIYKVPNNFPTKYIRTDYTKVNL